MNEENSKLDKSSCEVNDSEIIPIKHYTNLPFYKKMLKIEENSFKGALFSLLILSLGSTSLAVPQKVSYMSLILSPFVIIFSGLANLWSLLLLSSLYSKYKINKYDILVEKIYGKKLGILLGITTVFNQFGIVTVYNVILYKLLGGIINEIGGYGYEDINSFVKYSFWKQFKWKFFVSYGLCSFILIPLCLLKNISKMRYASSFGILSIFLLIFIVLIESPFFIYNWWNDGYTRKNINYFNIKKSFGKDFQFVKCITTLFYGFSCQAGVFPIITTLKNPSKKRINKVFTVGMINNIICYLIIGFSGYLTQPIDTPDLIIERRKIFKNDFIMTIGQMFFLFTVFAKISANYDTYRFTFLSLLNIDNIKFSNKVNYTITISTLILSTFISISFQSISDYLSLIGSFCTVIISYLIPGLLYIKGNDYYIYHFKNIGSIFMLLIICPIGLLSGIFVIKGIIEK